MTTQNKQESLVQVAVQALGLDLLAQALEHSGNIPAGTVLPVLTEELGKQIEDPEVADILKETIAKFEGMKKVVLEPIMERVAVELRLLAARSQTDEALEKAKAELAEEDRVDGEGS